MAVALSIRWGSKLVRVDGLPCYSIEKVKTLVRDRGGPAAELQRLCLLSRELENHRTLASYGIAQPKARLTLSTHWTDEPRPPPTNRAKRARTATSSIAAERGAASAHGVEEGAVAMSGAD